MPIPCADVGDDDLVAGRQPVQDFHLVDGSAAKSNLYTRGNTGAASILIMLDEFLKQDRIATGDTILCMVPESGRFNTAYIHLTVVEE